MDRTAIEAIRENQAFDIDGLHETNIPTVIIPATAKVESLEHLLTIPIKFIASFSTHICTEFTDYCYENGKETTSIYIDTDEMKALAIFDHGNQNSPEWGTHNAAVFLKKNPAYKELLGFNTIKLDQQTLIDFLIDWKENVSFFDVDDKSIAYQTGINRLRKLTLNKNSAADIEQTDFKSQASAMEQIEIKSGEDSLPAYFVFMTSTYKNFKKTAITCRIRALTSEQSLTLKYRIEGLQAIQEDISYEFRDQIKDQISNETSVYIGKMKLR